MKSSFVKHSNDDQGPKTVKSEALEAQNKKVEKSVNLKLKEQVKLLEQVVKDQEHIMC